MPKKRKNEPYIPSDDEVKKLIDYSKKACDGKFYVPIVLGCFGMSRSEICALSVEDIKDGLVTISKGKVLNDKKEWVIKDIPKTTARIRTIPVPHDIIDIINKQGYVFDGHPNAISNFIDNACKALKIEHFSLHKLRHYFATRLSSENIDVETILSLGGWSTDYVMKNVYRHKVDDKVKDASKRLETIILS